MGWGRALKFAVLFWPLGTSVVLLTGFRQRPVDSADLPANWDFRSREPRPQAVDVSGRALHHSYTPIAPIYALLFRWRPHSGMAASATHDGAASVSLVHDFDCCFTVGSNSRSLVRTFRENVADRHRGGPHAARRAVLAAKRPGAEKRAGSSRRAVRLPARIISRLCDPLPTPP